MVKRNLLLKNQFDLKFNFIEYFDLIFRLSFQTKFHFITIPTSYYRLHEKNLSKVKLEIFIEEFKKWINLNNNKFKNILSFKSLETRVTTMNNEMIKIDLLVSSALELTPPVDRVARASNFVEDGKIDARRD